jgi:cell division protein ZapA
MPQVTVHIGGRNYRMGCGPGEEAHLEGLAKVVDAKIEDMRAAFRDLDDQRIVVMAAVALADDLAEARRKAQAGEAAATDALARETAAREAAERQSAELEAAIEETAARVEALTESLNAPAED